MSLRSTSHGIQKTKGRYMDKHGQAFIQRQRSLMNARYTPTHPNLSDVIVIQNHSQLTHIYLLIFYSSSSQSDLSMLPMSYKMFKSEGFIQRQQ